MKPFHALASTILGACAALLPTACNAGAMQGDWIVHRDNGTGVYQALAISEYGSLYFYTGTPEGVSYAAGDVREEPGTAGRIRVTFRAHDVFTSDDAYAPDQTEVIEAKFDGKDRAEIWLEGEPSRIGVITRSNCNLEINWRNWTDPVAPGCRWLQLVPIDYSGLDGDCRWNTEHTPPKPGEDRPSECLLAVPEDFPSAGADL